MAKLFTAVCNISCVGLLVIGSFYLADSLRIPDDPDWLAHELIKVLHPKLR